MDAADPARREDVDPGRAPPRSSSPTTVVAAQPPPTSAAARFGRAAFTTDPRWRRRERLEVVLARARPITRPAWIATVAGDARRPRPTAASDARATSRFWGYGSPWLISVDSRATTGRRSRRAAATRGSMARRSANTCKRIGARRGGGTDRDAGVAALRYAGGQWLPPRPADPGDVIRAQVVLEEHDVAPDGSFAVVVRRIVERNGYSLAPLARPAGRQRDRHAATAHDRSRPRQPAADLARRPARGVPAAAPRGPGIAQQPAGARPGRRTGPGGEPAASRRRGGRLVARRQPPRVHGGGGAAAVPRRAGAPGRDAAGPGDPPPRLPLRRVGFLDRWAHLFVVAAAGSTDARQLTDGDFGVAGITWHPDGRTIAFAADRKPDADLRPGTSIWAVDAARATARPATSAGTAAGPRARRLGGPPGVLARRPLAGGRRRRRPGRSRRPEPDGLRRPGRRRWHRRSARAGPRPADRPLERHRPDRLDGREPDRPGLARSADA